MNDNHIPALAELEARLLRDPFDNVTRLAYARALLTAGRETDALAQYDLARKANATPALEEFERLRAPPAAPPPPREPVKLTVVPGARSAEVVSIARPVAVPDKTRFIHIAGMDDLKKSIRLQIIEPFINPGLFAKFRKKAGGGARNRSNSSRAGVAFALRARSYCASASVSRPAASNARA